VLREEKEKCEFEFESVQATAGGDLVILKEKMMEDSALALVAVEVEKELQLEGIRAQFEVEKNLLILNVRSEMGKEETLARKQEGVVMEQRLEELHIRMLGQMEEQSQIKDRELDEKINGVMKEQAVIMEADRIRSLKLEASKVSFHFFIYEILFTFIHLCIYMYIFV
jgi:hypothetical protein